MLLSNPYFWLGQIGLIMTLVSCAALAHRFREQSLYEILPFWFAGLMALAMMVRPAVINYDHTIPVMPYLYRFAVGLLVTSRVWVWRRTARLEQALTMDKIIRILTIASALFLVGLWYKLKNR